MITQYTTLSDFLNTAWSLIKRGTVDIRSSARTPTLATIRADGVPTTRTVVLRSVNQPEAHVEIYTDLWSTKVQELTKKSYGSFHFWLPKQKIQIRMITHIKIKAGPEVEESWLKVPLHSRESYGHTPPPGITISQPFEYQVSPSQDRFAVLDCSIQEMDLLYLGHQHQRAIYRAVDQWEGRWVVP